MHTVYDRLLGDFSARNNVHTPHIYYIWFWPALFIRHTGQVHPRWHGPSVFPFAELSGTKQKVNCPELRHKADRLYRVQAQNRRWLSRVKAHSHWQVGQCFSICRAEWHKTKGDCTELRHTHVGRLDSGYVREHFETKSTFHFTVLPIGKAHSRWQVGQWVRQGAFWN